MALDLTFPRAAKLRRKDQYDAVRKKGRAKRGLFFRLAFLTVSTTEAAPPQTQCGFIVSRRVGNAVVRNRVKRRLRELYREERSHIRPGLWLVLIATPQAATATFKELRDEWHCLTKNILC